MFVSRYPAPRNLSLFYSFQSKSLQVLWKRPASWFMVAVTIWLCLLGVCVGMRPPSSELLVLVGTRFQAGGIQTSLCLGKGSLTVIVLQKWYHPGSVCSVWEWSWPTGCIYSLTYKSVDWSWIGWLPLWIACKWRFYYFFVANWLFKDFHRPCQEFQLLLVFVSFLSLLISQLAVAQSPRYHYPVTRALLSSSFYSERLHSPCFLEEF